MNISFIPLSESHFPLLLKWLETAHVKKWWDQDLVYTLDLVKEKYGDYVKGYKSINGLNKPIQAYIICLDNQPIGYIQIYKVNDFPRSKPLTGLPENLGGIDVFIGEKEYLGKGLGSQAITKFLDLYAKGYSSVFVDPDMNNIAAIKAYKKAGFQKVSEQLDTQEIWMLKKLVKKQNLNNVVSIETAEHFKWGENCDGWWLKDKGNFTVIYEVMPEHTSEVKHYHQVTEQFFYVLEGKLGMELDDKFVELKANQGISIPPNVSHKAINCSSQVAKFLVISSPDSHTDRINLEHG